MEEILASIRRIISEDDAPASTGEETPPAAVHAAPETSAGDDDVLELTEPLQPPAEPEPQREPEPALAAPPPPPSAPETLGDLDVFSSAPAPPPAPSRAETLVSGQAADAAASHFGQLSRSIAMPPDGTTLEEVVIGLLRPLLKDWLDRHLPGIVEAKVQAEVERISRTPA